MIELMISKERSAPRKINVALTEVMATSTPINSADGARIAKNSSQILDLVNIPFGMSA